MSKTVNTDLFKTLFPGGLDDVIANLEKERKRQRWNAVVKYLGSAAVLAIYGAVLALSVSIVRSGEYGVVNCSVLVFLLAGLATVVRGASR